jgi:serine/threonine protein kinase
MNNGNELIGRMLGTCRIEQIIGRGGMGIVYLAQQTRPMRRVAVKLLIPEINVRNADFGLYFRNQPGNAQGIYTFLIHQDGSWSSYVYNNTTGEPAQIAAGSTGVDAHAPMTLDVVANGANFTFYVNGNQVGSVSNSTYPQGTVGVALDSGATLLVSNFVLYTIQ